MTSQIQAEVQVRAVCGGDAAALERFYAGLSPEARHHRFLATRAGITAAEARWFTEVDHRHREGFVATRPVADADAGSDAAIVGHLCLEPSGTQRVEFAIVVTDAAQHHYVGAALLTAGLAWARAHGIVGLDAVTEVDNVAMLHLAQTSDAWTTIGPATDGTVPLTLPTQP
jgi:uncharacterized protein YfiM (DUF2279 family)